MKYRRNQLNKTQIIIAVILGIALITFATLDFISKEKDRQLEQVRLQQEQKNELLGSSARQEALNSCLQKAEDEFYRVMMLNSVPASKPDYPDARRWNSNEIANSTQKILDDSKELCAKLYGTR